MKRKVSVILIALIMLTACAKKPEADEQKTASNAVSSLTVLENAINEIIESDVLSYILHLSNETNLLSERKVSLNNLNNFPQAKMIKEILVEGEALTATYINDGYIYYDFPGGQLKEQLTHETLEFAYGGFFDMNVVAYQLTILTKSPSFYDSKNFTTKSKDGGILYILDKENDNAKPLLDSFDSALDENDPVNIDNVSFHVKGSKLIGYSIEFRSQQNDFGYQEVFIEAVNDAVKFDFPDFSNYMEVPS